MKTRRIKVIKFTAKHAFNDIEHDVNEALDDLTKSGKMIISINPLVVSSTTPAYIIYNITYEETLPNSHN